MLIWNTRLIFEDAGGPEQLRGKLFDAGIEVPLGTIRAWEARGSIPAKWMAPIIHVLDVDARTWVIEDLF